MADRKSGPVKPPVIDLTARDATRSAADGRKTAAKAPARPKAATETSDQAASPSRRDRVRVRHRGAQARRAASGDAADLRRHRGRRPGSPCRGAPFPSPPSAARCSARSLPTCWPSWIALPSSAPRFADPAPALDRTGGAHLPTSSNASPPLEDSRADTQLSLDATIAQLDSGLADTTPVDRGRRARRSRRAAPSTSPASKTQLRHAREPASTPSPPALPRPMPAALATNLVGDWKPASRELTHALDGDRPAIRRDRCRHRRFAADLGAAKAAIAAQNQIDRRRPTSARRSSCR